MWNNMYEGVAALGRLKPTGLRHGGTHGTVLQRVPAPNSHLSRLNTKVTVPNQTSFLITAGLGIQERWLAASIYQSQLQAVQGSFLLLSQLPQPIHQWRCFLILPSMGLVLVVLGIGHLFQSPSTAPGQNEKFEVDKFFIPQSPVQDAVHQPEIKAQLPQIPV